MFYWQEKDVSKLWFIFCLCWLMGIVIPKYISSSNNDNNNHNKTQKVFFSQKSFPNVPSNSWSASEFFSPQIKRRHVLIQPRKLWHFAVAAVWEVIGYRFVQIEKYNWCNWRLATQCSHLWKCWYETSERLLFFFTFQVIWWSPKIYPICLQ